MVRSKADFFEHIDVKDIKTIDAYNTRVNNFEDYCEEKFKTRDILSKFTVKDDQVDFFQKYINWNKRQIVSTGFSRAPSAVQNFASSVRKYTYYRGWQIAKGDLSDLLELPTVPEKELYGLYVNDMHVIFDALNFNDTLLHCFDAVTGTRIGESVQLRKKHFSMFHDRIMVKIPSTIAKFKHARTTFVSKEFTAPVMSRLNRIETDDLAFGTSVFDPRDDRRIIANAVHASESTKGDTLRRALIRTGLDMKYEDTGRFQINTHSFRAWFITRMSRHDANLAKLFAGEKGYLLSYDRLTDEEKLEEYKLSEPRLMINDSTKQQHDLEQLKVRNAELEKTHIPKEKIEDMVEKKILETLTRLTSGKDILKEKLKSN